MARPSKAGPARPALEGRATRPAHQSGVDGPVGGAGGGWPVRHSSANGTGTSAGAPTGGASSGRGGSVLGGPKWVGRTVRNFRACPAAGSSSALKRIDANGSSPPSLGQPQPPVPVHGLRRHVVAGADLQQHALAVVPVHVLLAPPAEPPLDLVPPIQPVGPDQGLAPPGRPGRTRTRSAVTSVRASPTGVVSAFRSAARTCRGPRPGRPSPATGGRSRCRRPTGRSWTGRCR